MLVNRHVSDDAYTRSSKKWTGRILAWITILNLLVIGGFIIWYYFDPLVVGSFLVVGFYWMIPAITITILTNLIVGLIWLLGKIWPVLHEPDPLQNVIAKGNDIMNEQHRR